MENLQAIELRIGNLINYLGQPTKVNSIAGTDIFYVSTIKSGVMTGVCFEPILLTEEWLLKFRFTQCENKYWYEKGFFGISHEGCVNLQGRGNNEFVTEVIIKYVHQLQNLYFALTGYELIYET